MKSQGGRIGRTLDHYIFRIGSFYQDGRTMPPGTLVISSRESSSDNICAIHLLTDTRYHHVILEHFVHWLSPLELLALDMEIPEVPV